MTQTFLWWDELVDLACSVSKDLLSTSLAIWYADRSDSQMDVAEKLVKLAARLIASQIRDMPYNTDEYPNLDDISVDGHVPLLLRLFIEQLVHE